jgi:hypothetical protein
VHARRWSRTRQRREDKSFFDEEQYHTFVSEALEKLFKEEHGSIEEEDEI